MEGFRKIQKFQGYSTLFEVGSTTRILTLLEDPTTTLLDQTLQYFSELCDTAQKGRMATGDMFN